MTEKKVVVTGIGVVSPIGTGKEAFFAGLRDGRDGAGEIRRFDARDFLGARACEVKDFSISADRDPVIQFGLAAAREAWADGGIIPGDPERSGIVASSSKGGVTALFQENFKDFFPHQLSTELAREFRVRGPVKCIIAACATGTLSIIDGVRLIEQGEADVVLAGASDASVTPLMIAGYRRLGVYASGGMCPYDRRRDGFLVGEGAGFVLLEEKEHARARRAKIYGEILACEIGAETYRMTAFSPQGDSLARMLRRLLEKGSLKASDIDYLNTHGTSTREGDIYETEQIKKAFGKDACGISASSTKSMTGHMLGASGAVEFIACLLAMEKGFIPPTIHFEEPDPACDLDYTPKRSKPGAVKIACSFSMGFGGQMGGLLIGR